MISLRRSSREYACRIGVGNIHKEVPLEEFQREVGALSRKSHNAAGSYVGAYDSLVSGALLSCARDTMGIGNHGCCVQRCVQDNGFWQKVSQVSVPWRVAELVPQYLSGRTNNLKGAVLASFERELGDVVSNQVVLDMAKRCAYVPSFDREQVTKQFGARKKFTISYLPLDKIVEGEKSKVVTDEALQAFYQQRSREGGYTEPERRSGVVWRIDPASYGITVSDADVTACYDTQKASEFVSEQSKVVVRHLFLAGASSEERATARETLEATRKKLLSDPSQFAETACQLSQDERSARDGGLLPALSRDATDYEHEFIRTAFMMQKPESISEVVESAKGVHLLQLVERQPAVYRPLEEVRESITARLEKKAFRSALASLRDTHNPDYLKALAQERGIAPTKVDLVARGESSVTDRLFNLEVDQSATMVEDSAINVVTLSSVQERHTLSLASIKDRVRDDLGVGKAHKRVESIMADAQKRPDAFALAGPNDSYDVWLDPHDQSSLMTLVSQGLPIEHMVRLDKKGMFLAHGNARGGYLITLAELGTSASEGPDTDAVTGQLRRLRSEQYQAGFVASLRRNATIESGDLIQNFLDHSERTHNG